MAGLSNLRNLISLIREAEVSIRKLSSWVDDAQAIQFKECREVKEEAKAWLEKVGK
jgi:hypothetical protein